MCLIWGEGVVGGIQAREVKQFGYASQLLWLDRSMKMLKALPLRPFPEKRSVENNIPPSD